MNSDTPFHHIWQSYETMRECLKITQRSISKKDVLLLKKTSFLGQPENQATNQIKEVKVNMDDYVILSLWATFERFVVDYIEKQVSTSPSEFGKRLYNIISKNIEYWKIDDILDVLKVIIDPDLIGQAKQIKKYRDWVAHRNIKKKSPPNVVPEKAYAVLAEIYEKLTLASGVEPHIIGKGSICPECSHDELKFLHYGRGPLSSGNAWYLRTNCGYKFQNFESAGDD